MAHYSHLSPDGKSVLVEEMDTSGWLPCRLVPFTGGAGKQVGPLNGQCTASAWSPDSKWMYFTSNAGGHGNHIWRQAFPDGTPMQFTNGPSEEAGIAMAPDGRSFITSVGTEERSIWVHDQQGDRQVSSEGYAWTGRLSGDGSKLFYLVARNASEIDRANELWVSDLQSGQAAQVLPGIAVADYSVSADGKRVVYEVRNPDGTTQLWLGSVDHRFTPKPIGPPNGKSVQYARASGNIYFKVTEGNTDYLYRINEDGTQLEKLLPEPIISFGGVSPDESMVVVRRDAKGEGSPTVVEAVSLRGGHDVPLCSELCSVGWSFDGKTFYLRLPAMKSPTGTVESYVFPLAKGVDLPALPAQGVQSDKDVPKTVQVVRDSVIAGPDAGHYSFSRRSSHYNLYRVPIQ